MIYLLLIFILLAHLAYMDYKSKMVLVWEYVLLIALCVVYSYDTLSHINVLFAVVSLILPRVPAADRFGMASLSLINIHAVLLSIVISYVLEKMNITTAYYPSVLLSFLIAIFYQMRIKTVGVQMHLWQFFRIENI